MKNTEQVYDFLDHYKLAVVSSINENGLPSGAIVGFGQTKELEIIFGTDSTTRKYKNIQVKPQVAFTVGGETPETIQYEGVARELDDTEIDIVRNTYWQKSPFAEKHYQNPNQRYFIVRPTLIRFTDIRTTPWDITELTFN